jgi:8-oxo-dGTP pyrophosphatase MutT (NUDIX family)
MRQLIRGEFASITPCDERERADLNMALAWIDSGVELCRLAKPATPPIHLVAYFVVVDGASVLLVDHRNAQLWLPPGGHVDLGEHPRATVARELQEELGFSAAHAIGAPLFVTVTGTVGLTAGHTDVSLWYVVHASRAQALVFDQSEFTEVRWFLADEVPTTRVEPNLQRFLAKLALVEGRGQ